MKPDDNPFDRHIRDKMKNFTPDVSAGLWDKIEAGLARQTPDRAAMSVRRRTVPVAWRWAAAAALLVGVLSYWASRPVPVIYLQGQAAAPVAETDTQPAGPVTASRPTRPAASGMPGRTPIARATPRKTRSEPIPAVAVPIPEAVTSEPVVKQMSTARPSPVAAPSSPRATPEAGSSGSDTSGVPDVQPPVVLDDTAAEMLASTPRSNPFGVSQLLNFVVGTVDRREEKAVQFSSDSEGSIKIEFNLARNRRKK